MLLEVVQGRIRKMPKLDCFGSSLMRLTFFWVEGCSLIMTGTHISHISSIILCFFFLSVSSIAFTASPFLMRRDDSQFPLCLGYGFFSNGLSYYTALCVPRPVSCVYV